MLGPDEPGGKTTTTMQTIKLLFLALSSTLRGLADDGDRVRGELTAAHHATEEPHTDASLWRDMADAIEAP